MLVGAGAQGDGWKLASERDASSNLSVAAGPRFLPWKIRPRQHCRHDEEGHFQQRVRASGGRLRVGRLEGFAWPYDGEEAG